MASRPTTFDTHQAQINQALFYIQEHLDELPTLEELAAVASFSPFHFHRLFRAFTGESVSRYVRRIRLERAIHRLRFTTTDVTTIALDAGYETPSAFNKAFKKAYGVTPTQFRETAVLNIQKSNVQNKKQIVANLKPKIETIPEQKVLFVRKTGAYAHSSTAAWQLLMSFMYSKRLMRKETRFLGVSYDSPDITDEDKLRYDACVTIDKDVQPQGDVRQQTIGGGRYAIFLHRGPYENFDETFNAIYGDWLPRHDKHLRETPVFEEYLNRDPRRTKPENLRTKVYIPIM